MTDGQNLYVCTPDDIDESAGLRDDGREPDPGNPAGRHSGESAPVSEPSVPGGRNG